jgi:chemotaxis regulatin CheY-phosphate phosphatase CheZ
LESTYYDAIIEYMDRQIEEVEELYSSIDESNSRLLESIRESLELQRQEHQNAETETEINDMRNRLAYLQMDTSGAN